MCGGGGELAPGPWAFVAEKGARRWRLQADAAGLSLDLCDLPGFRAPEDAPGVFAYEFGRVVSGPYGGTASLDGGCPQPRSALFEVPRSM
jgi:hypothetical protein